MAKGNRKAAFKNPFKAPLLAWIWGYIVLIVVANLISPPLYSFFIDRCNASPEPVAACQRTLAYFKAFHITLVNIIRAYKILLFGKIMYDTYAIKSSKEKKVGKKHR